MKPEEYSRRNMRVAGWDVRVTSYRLGDRFYCTVDNVSPGAWIAKTEGSSREDAEEKALTRAGELLLRTRIVRSEAEPAAASDGDRKGKASVN